MRLVFEGVLRRRVRENVGLNLRNLRLDGSPTAFPIAPLFFARGEYSGLTRFAEFLCSVPMQMFFVRPELGICGQEYSVSRERF